MHDSANNEYLRLIEQHRSLLTASAKTLVGGKLKRKLDPEDLVQEVMQRAVQAFDDFEHKDNPEKVKAWLFTILENRAKDTFKHFTAGKRNVSNEQSAVLDPNERFPNIEALVPSGQTSPSLTVARGEQTDRLLKALQQIPEDVREIITYKHFQGKTLKEIAQLTDRTVPSVAGALRRGLAELRKHLD